MRIEIGAWGPEPAFSHFLNTLLEKGWNAHASPDDPSQAYAFIVPAFANWEGGVIDDTPPSSFTVISKDSHIDVERVDTVNLTFDTEVTRRDRRVTNRNIRINNLTELKAPSVIIEYEKRELQRDALLDSENGTGSATVAERFARLMKDTEEDRPEYLPRSGDELAYITCDSDSDDPCAGYATAIIDKYYDAGLRFRFLCWNADDQPRREDAEGNQILELRNYHLFFSAPSEEAEGKLLASQHCIGFINESDLFRLSSIA